MRALFAIVLLCWAATAGFLKGAEGGLAAYVDKDLRKLSPSEKVKFSLALAGTGEVEAKDADDPDSFEPYFVKRFRSGKAKWIFLEVYPGYNVPDVSAVRVHFFDEAWKMNHAAAFPTGYRFFIADAKVEENPQLKQDLLVVRVTSAGPFLVLPDGQKKPAFEQGDFQRQYYAFTGDQMVLVRLEDNKNQLIANSYSWSTPMKGGAVPKRTKTEWIDTLTSGSSVERLATMVWLSGSHLKSSVPRQENVNQETIEDSTRYEEVRDSERTKTAIQKLMKHDLEWIRAYAELVERSRDSNG